MSRVGKQPIGVPAVVQVVIDGQMVRVKGPKGELAHRVPDGLIAAMTDGKVLVTRRDDERSTRALHGLTRSLVANMVQGVAAGFEKALEIQGTGYRAAKSGRNLVMNLGFSHPVEIGAPEGIEIEVPTPTSILVKGADKALVGQVAADIRSVRRPEPYLGKGIRYVGERVRRKAGKTGKK